MTLPASPDAEAALIARLVVDPKQLPLVSGRLTPDDFYVREYRETWAAMQRLSASRRDIDLVALREEGAELSDPTALLTLGHRAPVEQYADTIRRYSFRRRAITTLEDVTRVVYAEDDQPTIISAIHGGVQKILHGVEDGRLLSVGSAVDEFLPELGVARTTNLSYGIWELDQMIQPPSNGDMIVIAARPSVGKTALVEQVVDHLARGAQYPVLFASLEMSRNQLTARAVARYGDMDHSAVGRGELTQEEHWRAEQVLDERRSLNLWYEDDPGATTSSLRTAAAKIRTLHGGITAIAVDYLQLLKDKNESEYVRVTRISNTLKQIAREFDCPLFALAQLNRQSTFRKDPHPTLSDLRDSGAIEQDADVVLGLHNPSREVRDIDILKNRNGPAGDQITVRFNPSRVRFE